MFYTAYFYLFLHYTRLFKNEGLFLAHHHPNRLVQVTVARDTLGAQSLTVIGVDEVVCGVNTTPHVKPLVSSSVGFRDPVDWIEVQSGYCGKTCGWTSLLIVWAVLVKSVHVLYHRHGRPHQELVEFFLVPLWCARLSVVNNPDVIDVSKAEHDLFPVPHAWVDMTRGICVLSFCGHCWEYRFYHRGEVEGDLCGN